jgi:hypothetical protein
MKKIFLGLAGLGCLVLPASCGSSHTDYSYTFNDTACSTGDMMFTSLQAMCTALQSDSVNSSCALAARTTFFMQHCTGTFTEAP